MLTRQDQVLATLELVELILVQLFMKDLLFASLVSKAWHATTLTPALQRALFFLPDPASAEPIQNPLLAALFPPFFGPSKCCQTWTIKAMPWAKAPDAFKRAQASWRRMLLTQPPARTMAITHTFGRSVRHAMLGSDVDPDALACCTTSRYSLSMGRDPRSRSIGLMDVRPAKAILLWPYTTPVGSGRLVKSFIAMQSKKWKLASESGKHKMLDATRY